jgi:hypothetical protein
MKICEKIKHIEAEDVAESGGYQTRKFESGEKKMKGKYIVGFGLVMMLVMAAVAVSAAAETKIGDIEQFTGARDKWEAQKPEFSLMQSKEECIEINYNEEFNGTINEFKFRIRGGNKGIEPEWFDLHINGENVGSADVKNKFTNAESDNNGGSTCTYIAWENIDAEINNTNVLFEIHKPVGKGTSSDTWVTYALYYGSTSENGNEKDLDEDGDAICKAHSTSPDGEYNGDAVEFHSSNGGITDPIYEFTYTEPEIIVGDESTEPEEEEKTNYAPNITLISPTKNEVINSSRETKFIAQVSDKESDHLTVYFYNAGNGNLLGYEELNGSGVADITVDKNTFEYDTMYTWYAKVIEIRPEAHTVDSELYLFSTKQKHIPAQTVKEQETNETQNETNATAAVKDKGSGGIIDEIGFYLGNPWVQILIAFIILLVAIKLFGHIRKRKKTGRKSKLVKKIKLVLNKINGKILSLINKKNVISLMILAIANIVLWIANAGLAAHIIGSIAIIAILYFYFNKKAYRKLRHQKDKFLQMFLSKDAKSKKTTEEKVDKAIGKKSKKSKA